METSLFSSPRFGGREPQFVSSSPRQNLDDVFADLTNQDVDPDAEPMDNLHATEALEALNASNGTSRAGSAHDESAPTGDAQPAAEPAAVKKDNAEPENPQSEL
jgi:histone demethylase JARID1